MAATRKTSRGFVLPTVVAAAAFAVLCALGIWQVERLAWKEALIARVEAGLDADPVAAPTPAEWVGLDLVTHEYQPVTVRGIYDHAREIRVVHTLVEPKGPLGGIGYLVLTPFRTDAGWWVYVNRGFVRRDHADPASRAAGQIEGEAAVTGLLRAPSRRSWFTPADDAAANAWFSRDPALFAAEQGLPPAEVAPYLIDLRFDPDLPGGMPQGGETIVAFTNNHLQYALTWFGLAAALAAVYAAFAWKRIRG
ncbi:MAG: SURF1 family protein [Bauldia sp.]|nr:SURF1 family protein [Bauldia sp.]